MSTGAKNRLFLINLKIRFKRFWIEWTWWKNAKFSVTFDPRWITSQSWTRLKEISWFNIVTKDFPFCPSFFLESNKFHVKILQVRFMGIHRDATPLWINGYKWSGVCVCLCVCVESTGAAGNNNNNNSRQWLLRVSVDRRVGITGLSLSLRILPLLLLFSSSLSLLFIHVCVCVCVCVFHGLWPLLWHLATLCGIRWGFLARICTSSSFLIDLINLNKSKKWKQCAHEASLSKFPRSIQRLRRWNNYGSGFIAIPIDGMDSGAGSCRRGP